MMNKTQFLIWLPWRSYAHHVDGFYRSKWYLDGIDGALEFIKVEKIFRKLFSAHLYAFRDIDHIKQLFTY